MLRAASMRRTTVYALTFLLWIVVAGALASATAARLDYTLYVLGVPIADAALVLDLQPSSYGVALAYNTTGIVGIFADNRLEEHASGRFEKAGPAPVEYGSKVLLHGQNRLVDMVWRDGTPTVTAIDPPNQSEREDVPEAARAHAIDPLSSIVMLLRLAAVSGRCDGAARTYDGRRLVMFQSRSGQEEDIPFSGHSSFQGRGLRCDFTDTTLAGFRLGAGRAEDMRQHDGTIWLAQVLPGSIRLPVRASIATRYVGDATIYLTGVSP
jgi:hypothetical protein